MKDRLILAMVRSFLIMFWPTLESVAEATATPIDDRILDSLAALLGIDRKHAQMGVIDE